ncbi:unnamed protein product [Nezara viridula]|uniref:Uncharacterized protein n=1 Tax=Nezara viridula TaxID=85310 RepID=A0A9P0MPT0_NEZVI|nr:unnamed protein product [Nezara viridula]
MSSPLTITAVPAPDPALQCPPLRERMAFQHPVIVQWGQLVLGSLGYVIRLVTLYRAGWIRKWWQFN